MIFLRLCDLLLDVGTIGEIIFACVELSALGLESQLTVQARCFAWIFARVFVLSIRQYLWP